MRMKTSILLFNTLRRSVLCFMLLMSTLAVGFTSCSDDEEDETPPQEGGIDIGVPPSVVDGVRPSELSDMKINYNDDGTISNVVVDGCVFTFNYAATKAATRQLNSITADGSNGYSTESWKADNFILSDNGFIGGYHLTYNMNEPRYEWWEKGDVNYVFTYRSDGRIEKFDMSGTFSDAEEVNPFSDSGTFSYAYGQNGELLSIKGTSQGFTFFQQKMTYGMDLDNKYNTMLLTLTPEDVISDDAVFRILAVAGYLGNASKKLPTQLRLIYSDDEDETLNLSYSIGANGMINWYGIDGQQYDCKFVDASKIEIN